jgi:hypothetical protein
LNPPRPSDQRFHRHELAKDAGTERGVFVDHFARRGYRRTAIAVRVLAESGLLFRCSVYSARPGYLIWRQVTRRLPRESGPLLAIARKTGASRLCRLGKKAPESLAFRGPIARDQVWSDHPPLTTSIIAWVLMTICVSSNRWKL